MLDHGAAWQISVIIRFWLQDGLAKSKGMPCMEREGCDGNHEGLRHEDSQKEARVAPSRFIETSRKPSSVHPPSFLRWLHSGRVQTHGASLEANVH